MTKTENRAVTITICDFCHEEHENLERCGICRRDMCMEDGGKRHAAYGLEIYRYRDGARLAGFGSHICQECAQRSLGILSEVFNALLTY